MAESDIRDRVEEIPEESQTTAAPPAPAGVGDPQASPATRNIAPGRKVRWGVLGAAKIALTKVIPAMQNGVLTEIAAIASRDPEKARAAASRLGIRKAYGSYEELVADPDIDAIYNPLPNHLHVPWSVLAADAGKHVLCEKPLGLTPEEVALLIEARDRNRVQVAEAVMVRTHPQWLRTWDIVQSGEIGDLRAILGAFSYFNTDPANIRNQSDFGGGALMDIGFYPIHLSRFLFGSEPRNVIGLFGRDSTFRTDVLTSCILNFPQGHSVFTCSTQLVPHQQMQILGTKGRIAIEIPFNAPPDRATRILVDAGGALDGSQIRVEEFAICDQYMLQGDAFSRAIQGEGSVPVPLEDSLANMQVIEALFRAGSWGRWEAPGDIPPESRT